jgi:hypothetical protein
VSVRRRRSFSFRQADACTLTLMISAIIDLVIGLLVIVRVLEPNLHSCSACKGTMAARQTGAASPAVQPPQKGALIVRSGCALRNAQGWNHSPSCPSTRGRARVRREMGYRIRDAAMVKDVRARIGKALAG